ncbi:MULTISPECIES: glutamate 5-kinase [Spongiibacter]|uniref:glutamate 5-kinase n=1 Tax=Spongiibacter TaxID=630749 RepID=UPI000C090A37|nr:MULTISPECIES: glutamate 5-kinase [unclassified Spongiibacter]MAK43567.1 glutamate 5-kinase [Spongiibacter sp.]MBM7422262.1 glutamate 5-kinase [Spongiibacter marinus]MEE2651621.1 glutamate 5-kinase [Pseudomonadota bacterium]
MTEGRQQLSRATRIVVKIGSALLTNDGQGLCVEGLDAWVAQIAGLRAKGCEIVLVSSGAVAEGMTRLGWSRRPEDLHHLQAAAAVGQMGLVQAYEARFREHGLQTAQILLGHDDISARDRYLNARGTLLTLLGLSVLPIVNENDSVVTDEIRFGDNDTLAALVANLIDADALLILTDQSGLYSSDPRYNPEAELVSEADAADKSLDAMVGGSAGSLGRGGMMTKLRAARLAARSGANTLIAGGREPDVLSRALSGEALGTLLLAKEPPMTARKKWLAGQLRLRGSVVVDDGAARVLRQQGRSLLSVGVVAARGQFERGDLVSCIDAEGREVARGLVNYRADEVVRIAGKPTAEIAEILGYLAEPELIHRDNMVVMS